MGTLAGIANTITQARRARSWRAPVPFEAGLCVYVNVVPMMKDGLLPFNCQHVVKAAEVRNGWKSSAYNHLTLRIDQLDELNWDFRIWCWDAAWGWEWSTYFAQA